MSFLSFDFFPTLAHRFRLSSNEQSPSGKFCRYKPIYTKKLESLELFNLTFDVFYWCLQTLNAMGESLKKAYQLKRVSSRVFKQADIYLSKVYGTYFGQKWPLIRSALQEPENLIPLSSLPSLDHRSVGRKKALDSSLGGNVFGELSQLKTKLQQVCFVV